MASISALARSRTRSQVSTEEPIFLDNGGAGELEGLFKILGNRTRLRLLHALAQCGELPVGRMAALVEMSYQAVSNHLRSLAGQGIVEGRREGTQVFYRIVDPCVPRLLESGLCITAELRAPRGRKVPR